jgi:hypothetical protein
VITRQRNILGGNSHGAQESVCTQFTFLVTTGKCKCLKELKNKQTKNTLLKELKRKATDKISNKTRNKQEEWVYAS